MQPLPHPFKITGTLNNFATAIGLEDSKEEATGDDIDHFLDNDTDEIEDLEDQQDTGAQDSARWFIKGKRKRKSTRDKVNDQSPPRRIKSKKIEPRPKFLK